jgi:hypothetical protein
LVVHLLDRRETLLRKGLVALQVELGALEHRGVPGALRRRLIERGLVRCRIDLGHDVALVDLLPLADRQGNQRAVHLRLDLNDVVRLDGAEAVEVDGHVLDLRGRGRHRDLRRWGRIVGSGLNGAMQDAPGGEDANGDENCENADPAGRYHHRLQSKTSAVGCPWSRSATCGRRLGQQR